jgi:hypothetical protein
MCRRWSGAPFFGVDATKVTFEGEEQIGRYTSSNWAERGFCKACGTTLFYFLKPASRYSLSIGLFDEAALFRLTEEIYIDHKPDSYALVGDHPRLTEKEVLAKYGA